MLRGFCFVNITRYSGAIGMNKTKTSCKNVKLHPSKTDFNIPVVLCGMGVSNYG